MDPIEITVASGTQLNIDEADALLNIEVTNTAEIVCKAGTSAYYFVELSDGTNQATYTFVVENAGTITASHTETFIAENAVLGTVTASSGVIYYTPV